MTRRLYLTKSGVLVEARGRVGDKVHAYRVATGGYHGLLWLKNLREVTRRG